MDDLFYFPKEAPSVEALCGELRDLPAKYALQVFESGFIIRNGAGRIVLHTERMDLGEFSPEDQSMLAERGITSCYSLSHHPRDFDEHIRPIVKRWLTRFGGFIGSDEDEFEPTLDLSSIDGPL